MASEPTVRYMHDGEWAHVGVPGGGTSLMVYPRDEETSRRPTTYSIGRANGGGAYDLDGQTGFENMQAAVDQARWLVTESTILARL